jgi:hypothetical protein
MVKGLERLICFALVAFAAVSAARAQDARLIAEVDRPTIRANESFHYILRAEGRIAGRPDLSALERDFEILDSRSSSRIQIVNGQRSEIAEWIYQLMPRRDGEIEIPAAEVGGLVSNTVRLEVLPAPDAGGAQADIFMEAELHRSASYVQAQAIYTLRLFIGVGTSRATLTPPLIEGGEAIIEKLGDDREYQTVRGNRDYYVRERRYAIFPQTAGTLRIGPATFEVMVIPSDRFSSVQRLTSDVVELEVKSAVAPPASHPGAAWLPAAALGIAQEWSDAGAPFTRGVPRTRVLTVVADGLLETQLPELDLGAAEGLRQYPDQPELFREVSTNGIEARRVERYAVIAQRDGAIELPAVELPWWNVETERWEIARLEAESIEVLPGSELETSADPDPAPAGAAAPAAPEPGGNPWPWISAALAIGWLATIAAWTVRARSARVAAGRPDPGSRPPSGRALVRELKAACRVDDAERAQRLLLEWAGLQFPEAPPASLGRLADRLNGPLAAEVRALEAALYGPNASRWSGRALAELIQSTQAVHRRGRGGGDDDPLVPLYR